MSAFQHPVLHSPRQIRLIWLGPSSSRAAPLSCEMRARSLDEDPLFWALSYSWESSQNSFGSIVCNGVPLKISANCEAALRRLRLDSLWRVLWIDAICIDQESIPDKNQQIPLMREIYGQAEKVVVWLGEKNKYSDEALMRMRTQPLLREDTGEVGMCRETVEVLVWAFCLPCICWHQSLAKAPRNKSSSPINPNSRVGSMFDIFSRSVFERMWCVQEVAVARQVELICGDAWITWDQLISGLATLERAAKFSNDSNKDIELFKNRIALQENLRRALRLATTHPEASRLSLSRLLDATSERGSTNPKDKVFALDGLLRLMGVNMPSPDYSKPVRQIYQDMTVTAIQQDGNLNILYQLTGFPTEYGLSSWVPDFSDTNCPKMISYSAFHASRDSPCRWQFAAGALHLRGKAVVKVATCGAAICEQSTTLRGFCSIPESQRESNLNFDTFKQWSSLANSLSTYPTKESVNDAFMRTLITDLVRGDGLDFDKFFNVCKTWHNMLATGLSADLFFDAGISQMLDDILSLVSQTQARQKQFARSIVAARLAWIITGRTSVKSRARSFHYWLYTMLRRKSFFLTDNGWMGIAPSSVQEGDTVVLFSGLKTPMLIRELDDGRWRLLAPAYVHGMMTGWLWGDNTSLVEFELI